MSGHGDLIESDVFPPNKEGKFAENLPVLKCL